MDDFLDWSPIFHDGIIKEFLVAVDKPMSQSFNKDSRVKAACVKANCCIELTPRFIRKRAGLYKEDKYFIVRAYGPNDQSIEKCNKLIEAIFPFYSQRKVYHRKKQRKPELGDMQSEQVSPWDIYQQLNATKSSSIDLEQIASNIANEKEQQQNNPSGEPQLEERHHKAYRHPKEDVTNIAVIEGKPYRPIDDTTECPHLTRPSQWGFFAEEDEELMSEAFYQQTSFAENSNSEFCFDLSDHEQFMTCLNDSLRRSQYWSSPPERQQQIPPLFYRNPLRETTSRSGRKKEKKNTKAFPDTHNTNANNCLEFERRRRIYQSIALNFQSAWRNLLTNLNNKSMISPKKKRSANMNNSISTTVSSSPLTEGPEVDYYYTLKQQQEARLSADNDINTFLEPKEEDGVKKLDTKKTAEENELDDLINDFQKRKQMSFQDSPDPLLLEEKEAINRRIEESREPEKKVQTQPYCPNLLVDEAKMKENVPTRRYNPLSVPVKKTEESEIDRQIKDFMARRKASGESCQYPNPSALFHFVPAHDVSFYPRQRQKLWQKEAAQKYVYPGNTRLEQSKRQLTTEYHDSYKPYFTPSLKPTSQPVKQKESLDQFQPVPQTQPPMQFQYSTPIQQPQRVSSSQDQNEPQNQIQKVNRTSTGSFQSVDSQLQLQQQIPGQFSLSMPQQTTPWAQPQLPTSQWYPYTPPTCAICPHGFIQDNSERRTNQARSRAYQERRHRKRSRHRRHHRRTPDRHRRRRHRRRSPRHKYEERSPRSKTLNDTRKEMLEHRPFPIDRLLPKQRDQRNLQALPPPLVSVKSIPDQDLDEKKRVIGKQNLTGQSEESEEAVTKGKTEPKINLKNLITPDQVPATSKKEEFTSGRKKAPPAIQKGETPPSKKEELTSGRKKAPPAIQKGETPPSKKEELTSGRKKAPPAIQKGETPPSKKEELTSGRKKASPAIEEGETPISKKEAREKKLVYADGKEDALATDKIKNKIVILPDETWTSSTKKPILTNIKKDSLSTTSSEKKDTSSQRTKKMTMTVNEPSYKKPATSDEKLPTSEPKPILDSDLKHGSSFKTFKPLEEGKPGETPIDTQDVFKWKDEKVIDERMSVGSFGSTDSTTQLNPLNPDPFGISIVEPIKEKEAKKIPNLTSGKSTTIPTNVSDMQSSMTDTDSPPPPLGKSTIKEKEVKRTPSLTSRKSKGEIAVEERESVGSFGSTNSTTQLNPLNPDPFGISVVEPIKEKEAKKIPNLTSGKSTSVPTNISEILTSMTDTHRRSQAHKRAFSDSDKPLVLENVQSETDTEYTTDDSEARSAPSQKPMSVGRMSSLHPRHRLSKSEEDFMSLAANRRRQSMVTRPSSLFSTTDGRRKSIFDILAGSRMSVMSGRPSVASVGAMNRSRQKSYLQGNFSNLALAGPLLGQEDIYCGNVEAALLQRERSRLGFNFLKKKGVTNVESLRDKECVIKAESAGSMDEFFWKIIRRLDGYSPDITSTTSSSTTVQNRDSKKEAPLTELSENVSVSRRVDTLRRYISRLISFDVSPRSRKKRQNWKNFLSSTSKTVIK